MSPSDGAARAPRPDPAPARAGAGYVERLTPAWWLYLVLLVFAAGLGLVVAPFGAPVAWGVAAAAAVALAAVTLATAGTLAVTGGEVVAGRARIPVHLLGPAEALDPAAMARARGPELDARAYLCLRGWIGPGVRVRVTDPADPAPYWLVSSRSPDRFVAALAAAQRDRPGA